MKFTLFYILPDQILYVVHSDFKLLAIRALQASEAATRGGRMRAFGLRIIVVEIESEFGGFLGGRQGSATPVMKLSSELDRTDSATQVNTTTLRR